MPNRRSSDARAVSGEVELLADVLEVCEELFLRGEAFGPRPVAPDFIEE
jgi:hypothetical protein